LMGMIREKLIPLGLQRVVTKRKAGTEGVASTAELLSSQRIRVEKKKKKREISESSGI